MTHQHESIPDLMQEDTFEVVMRGYNRRQVHDYMMRTRNQIRDLEERLARAIEQAEQGRIELAEARRRMVETPQSYEDLSPRLAQILRLGEEEAAAKREDAEAEATSVRESAKAESERLLSTSRETADKILTSAQAEAERRVSEATQAAENMLAQAGSDAEEQLTSARTEADETLKGARAEAERLVTGARTEADQTITSARTEAEQAVASANAQAEQTVQSANAQAEQIVSGARAEADSMLEQARQRTAALDEQAGRRVDYLSNTHSEVVRRLTEVSAVLGDLMRAEANAGPLVPDAIMPPAGQGAEDAPSAQEDVRVVLDPEETVEVVVDKDAAEQRSQGREEGISDDTDVNIARLSEAHK
ncbi:hypothetical protein AB0M50_12440 [Nonomuraea fuscirosea]|uniref:hypothetical protein n=1 Tax=Nonomuraea fuscirosea TaxID=1291556 RepID=UPI002DD98BBF|nr:hypothetical protein [Nonomuraea fuscirosea]WSA51296.1 hypothetical protein OIE67_45825 [Nonomuraea fuscirosea]